MAKRRIRENKILFEEARQRLVGGVDSPVRSFSYAGADPILIKRGRGPKVYDYDGNAYIDYVLSWGSLILGHANPVVLRDLKRALNSGLSFGTTNDSEIKLARMIQEAIPFIDRIRFVNSGTEAVMGAIRLARGYTGRDKIVKFEGAYHGHADYLLTRGGSGLATLQIPSSAGVPKDFVKHTLVIPFGDIEATKYMFRRYSGQIAAVIVEPVGANYGVVLPDVNYLKKLREITKTHGALLIFDEIITAFRFNFGAIAQEFGIAPDLICLGKIIGGGLPIGAYGGKWDIMEHLAPLGKVYQASTFSGNPIVMQAGISTLKLLKALGKDHARIKDLTRYLSANLKNEARERNIDMDVTYYGSIFSIKFKNKKKFRSFYRHMLESGVYFAPSEFEVNFLSLAHTKRDIDKTIACARSALAKIRRR